MKTNDIIKQTLQLLNISFDTAELEDNTETTDETILTLLNCLNMAITDTLSGHIRLYATETLTSRDGRIDYSILKENILEPISVYTAEGRAEFDIYPEYVKTISGEIVFTYSYLPKTVALNDDFRLHPAVTAQMLAYKTASVYSVKKGLNDKAAYFDKLYKDALGLSAIGRRYRPMPRYYGG